MGKHTDAAGMGFPFRPTPASLAAVIWDFDPRTADGDGAPDIPESPDFTLVNWKVSADGSTRVDFSDEFAALFPRVWGYIARIEESPFATTPISFISPRSYRR